MSTTLARGSVTLDDKYKAEAGVVLVSGIQAILRLMFEQRRLDQRRELNTAIYASGYPGSPLGGLDRELQRNHALLQSARVRFQPALNEELAATAVGGTQLLGELDSRKLDGVTGFWFGKAPGLDRAADAIRHSNLSGTAPLGGAVALIGDDPMSKSSTVPSSSEPLCMSLGVPLLAPGTVEEIVTLGVHAVEMSRHAGLWTGLKIVADIADASATIHLDGILDAVPSLPLREPRAAPVLLPPSNLDMEEDLLTGRLQRALDYARLTKLNGPTNDVTAPRLAIVAAGMSYQAVLRAFSELGVGDDVDRLGVRLVKLAMPWPLDRRDLATMLGDAETVLVVEDKRPFIETLVRDALYGRENAPSVIGKYDDEGWSFLPFRSAVTADTLIQLVPRILPELASAVAARRTASRTPDPGKLELPLVSRTPYFCSGCPHNVSTRADPDHLVGVGIGCHAMVTLDVEQRRGRLLGMTQMGGEGMQWLGLAPFTTEQHFIQNIGDGTFHHSGSLAIRAATAAEARMTFKLLYNDAVAMTGGQDPEGRMAVPELTRWLALEGVKQVVVTTPEPDAYRGVALDPIATVRHRDDLQAAQRELASVDGVTVLIHDDRCATEKRRLRKRGKLPTPTERVWINERVCEGCGDCGDQSSCLSVQPVKTEFGRKTQIHQSSCNSDMTCLKGDCPSFVLVKPANADAKAWPEPPAAHQPTLRVTQDVLIRMPGIGGTGVVTASSILQMAAHLDGRHAQGLEQIGLAQKGGPVISDVRISDRAITGQLRATAASIDVLLGFDLLGAAAPETLAVCDPSRTIAVLSTSEVPTARMVVDKTIGFPPERLALQRVESVSRANLLATVDAERLAERLFGDHMPANMLLVGVAFQHGCIPLSVAAIEHAIELNGAAVKATLAAFRWGRAVTADPSRLQQLTSDAQRPMQPTASAEQAVARSGLTGQLARTVAIRYGDLERYQNQAYAAGYLEAVVEVAEREREQLAGDGKLTSAYAHGLYKLMSYKDEYEVARLHLDRIEQAKREAVFGANARHSILLHPPLLRALGLERKLRISARIARPLFLTLVAMRRLRGTPLDIFGRGQVRRVERALVNEYRELVADAIAAAAPEDHAGLVRLIETADLVCGYEQIKLRSVESFRTSAREARALIGR